MGGMLDAHKSLNFLHYCVVGRKVMTLINRTYGVVPETWTQYTVGGGARSAADRN